MACSLFAKISYLIMTIKLGGKNKMTVKKSIKLVIKIAILIIAWILCPTAMAVGTVVYLAYKAIKWLTTDDEKQTGQKDTKSA